MLSVKMLSKYYTTSRIRYQLPALQQTYLRIFHEFIILSISSQQNGQMWTVTRRNEYFAMEFCLGYFTIEVKN